MNKFIQNLLRTQVSHSQSLGIIPWSSPILGFGDFQNAKLATLGINPSNREFATSDNIELDGAERRFPTLSSLNLDCWLSAGIKENKAIIQACLNYFSGNPYDLWFGKLDQLLRETGYSFYKEDYPACHLDLAPWATKEKWSYMPGAARRELLNKGAPYLAQIINESSIDVLVLNGRTVIDGLLAVADCKYTKSKMRGWDLPRSSGSGVPGYAYEGVMTSICDVRLSRKICILGYNHNLQSSFGVTKAVQNAIGSWLGRKTSNFINNGKTITKRKLLRCSA